jgi:hypothetical protein
MLLTPVLVTPIRLLLVDLLPLVLLALILLGRRTKSMVHGLIGRQLGAAQEPPARELSKPQLAPLFGAPSMKYPGNKKNMSKYSK